MTDIYDITTDQLERMQDMVEEDMLHALKNTYLPLYDKYCAQYNINEPFDAYLDGSYELDEDVYLSMLAAAEKVLQVSQEEAESLIVEQGLDELISDGIDTEQLIRTVLNE